MFLSKLVFNLHSRKAINAVVNANEMHKLVMSMFKNIESDTPRKELSVLYSLDIGPTQVGVLVQSLDEPNADKLLNDNTIISIQTKSIDKMLDSIEKGSWLRLEVLSEPYKKVENINSKNSRRKVLTNEEEKLEWFNRKISANGCFVKNEMIVKKGDTVYGQKKNLKFVYHPSVYSCIIKIDDKDKFNELVKNGIGSGKAYGMGMLKIFKK